MSRLRTIKPSFFTDEHLADCQPLARLLFAGLWTIADREGRLEDRPRRIKVECLPYDECDCHLLLEELAEHGFIIRYGSAGERYIAIPTWHKHQNPHIKETASTIPDPVECATSTMQAPCKNGASTNLGDDEPGRSCLVSCHSSCLGDTSPAKPTPRIPFTDYWSLYPKKTEVKTARGRWSKLSPDKRSEALSAARVVAEAVSSGAVDVQYVPGGAVFLNERWPEWADGVPAHYGNGRRNGQVSAADLSAARAMLSPSEPLLIGGGHDR